jgi:hypothetical protein
MLAVYCNSNVHTKDYDCPKSHKQIRTVSHTEMNPIKHEISATVNSATPTSSHVGVLELGTCIDVINNSLLVP